MTTGIRARAEGRRAHGSVNRLADAENPLVQQTAARLCQGCQSSREQVKRLVSFVRDDIKSGLSPAADWTSAPQTQQLGSDSAPPRAPCSPLCATRLESRPDRTSRRSAGASSEVSIRGLWHLLLPRHLSHSWLEADADGRWRRVDAYINDDAFCQAAARELERHGWPQGCSLAGTYRGGEAIDLDAGQFIQMEAVEGDDGVWTEPPIITRALTTGTGPHR